MSRILIADDHPLLLSGISQLLESSGHEVVAKVADGGEVLYRIEEMQPDIVILDVNMPGANGIEIVRALRQRNHEAGIVLLTAELTDDQLLEAIELRVDGILHKNGGERLLVDCIDKVAASTRFIPQELLNRATALQQARERDPLRKLTPRELQLAELVSQGMRNRTIAEQLELSEGTVKVYLNRIFEKLGISSRTELLIAMSRRGTGKS